MNRIQLSSIVAFLMLCFCAMVLPGCSKDASDEELCEGVTCENGGICVSGTCGCPEWYAGSSCELVVVHQYVDVYIGTLITEDDTVLNAEVTLIKRDDDQSLRTQFGFYIQFDTPNYFSIPTQDRIVFPSGDEVFATGSGSIFGKELRMHTIYKPEQGGSSREQWFVGER